MAVMCGLVIPNDDRMTGHKLETFEAHVENSR
jgi:hypothetical protein